MAFILSDNKRASVDHETGVEFVLKGRSDVGMSSYALHDPSSSVKTPLGVGYFQLFCYHVYDGADFVGVTITRSAVLKVFSDYMLEKNISLANLESIITSGLTKLFSYGAVRALSVEIV